MCHARAARRTGFEKHVLQVYGRIHAPKMCGEGEHFRLAVNTFHATPVRTAWKSAAPTDVIPSQNAGREKNTLHCFMRDTAPSLQQRSGDLITNAAAWAQLSDSALRRAAMKAANERNIERLWSLAEAHLVLHSRSGSQISEHTLRSYEYGVRTLVEMWEGENLLRPSRGAGLLYVHRLKSIGLSPGTIQVRLAAAKQLYSALRWAQAVNISPFEDVQAPVDPTPPEEKTQAYTEEQVQALLDAAPREKDRLLILLFAHGGLRVSEAIKLTWADIDFTANTLRVVEGKGRKTATIHMSSALQKALHARAKSLGTPASRERVLWYSAQGSVYERIKHLCGLAEVPMLGVHSLRHYCATRIYHLSGDLRLAARHLRHASTRTTEIYAKMDLRKYSEAIKKLE